MNNSNSVVGDIPVRRPRSKHAPLSYERIAILMAVATGPIDRSQVAGTIIADTVASIVIKTSTLYYLIRELTQAGHIKRQGSLTLTDKGRNILKVELNRIEQQRYILKQRLHI